MQLGAVAKKTKYFFFQFWIYGIESGFRVDQPWSNYSSKSHFVPTWFYSELQLDFYDDLSSDDGRLLTHQIGSNG